MNTCGTQQPGFEGGKKGSKKKIGPEWRAAASCSIAARPYRLWYSVCRLRLGDSVGRLQDGDWDLRAWRPAHVPRRCAPSLMCLICLVGMLWHTIDTICGKMWRGQMTRHWQWWRREQAWTKGGWRRAHSAGNTLNFLSRVWQISFSTHQTSMRTPQVNCALTHQTSHRWQISWHMKLECRHDRCWTRVHEYYFHWHLFVAVYTN